MGALADWLDRTRERDPLPEPAPVAEPVPPPRLAPLDDAPHLAALLAEGAEPLFVNGQLFLPGTVTPRAKALLAEHGDAIARLLGALLAGRVDRQALAAALATDDGWRWPGTVDAPAKWPGRLPFALGVPLTRCVECRRWDGRLCTRYGRLPEPRRAVRCLWALPRARKAQ